MTTVWTGGLANWAEAGLRAVSSDESLLLQGSGSNEYGDFINGKHKGGTGRDIPMKELACKGI